MVINVTLPSAPRTKKTSNRIVRFGRNREHVKIMPSEAYIEWEAGILLLKGRIRSGLRGVPLPIDAPVEIEARIFREKRTGDLAGYLQAIGDVIQAEVIRDAKLVRRGLGIIRDDSLIHRWDASLDLDPANPRIELRISTLQPVQESML
jgi:hypothetical protein